MSWEEAPIKVGGVGKRDAVFRNKKSSASILLSMPARRAIEDSVDWSETDNIGEPRLYLYRVIVDHKKSRIGIVFDPDGDRRCNMSSKSPFQLSTSDGFLKGVKHGARFSVEEADEFDKACWILEPLEDELGVVGGKS